MGKRIVVEDRSAYFNLPWMVARDEGLLEKEGLDISFVPPANRPGIWGPQPSVDHKEVDSFRGHVVFEEGTIDLFNACEWGRGSDGFVFSTRLYNPGTTGPAKSEDSRELPLRFSLCCFADA